MTTPIESNLVALRQRVSSALSRAGRPPGSVTLVAVSKTHPPEAIIQAYAAGQQDFGENYAQEMVAKIAALSHLPKLRMHFIGSLQTNKVKLVVGKVALIHSVDRIRLLDEISRRAEASALSQPILFEVHLSPEPSKSGCTPAELPALVARAVNLPGVEPRGLMVMPPFSDNPESSRPYFVRLRELLLEMQARFGLKTFDQLSMGMSNDFEVAIEEGATIIRVGTAIFGERRRR